MVGRQPNELTVEPLADGLLEIGVHDGFPDPFLDAIPNGRPPVNGQEVTQRSVAEIVADADQESGHRAVEFVGLGEFGELVGNARSDVAEGGFQLCDERQWQLRSQRAALVLQQRSDETPDGTLEGVTEFGCAQLI